MCKTYTEGWVASSFLNNKLFTSTSLIVRQKIGYASVPMLGMQVNIKAARD